MAAVLTGSPVAVTWASGSAPAAQNITIPADATAVYFFFEYYEGVNGFGINTVTLGGNAPNQLSEIVNLGSPEFESCTGVAIWYNPATGTKSLQVTWDTNPGEGPSCAVVFVKDGDTTAARDIKHAHAGGTTAVSATLTTVAGDLVIKFDRRYDGGGSTPPSLSSGWTNGTTAINNSSSSRLSYKSAAGTSETINSEDENYSSVTAVAIAPGTAPATVDQARFRWRNDDGSETTATWAAAEGADITVAALTPKRLRVQVAATGDPSAKSFKLQYRKVGDGTWRDIN